MQVLLNLFSTWLFFPPRWNVGDLQREQRCVFIPRDKYCWKCFVMVPGTQRFLQNLTFCPVDERDLMWRNIFKVFLIIFTRLYHGLAGNSNLFSRSSPQRKLDLSLCDLKNVSKWKKNKLFFIFRMFMESVHATVLKIRKGFWSCTVYYK